MRDRVKERNMLDKLKKKTRIWLILIGAVAGVILLLVGGAEKEESVRSDADSKALVEYSESVEKKIYEICSKVKGVSNVSVAVSFESGFEYVYAKEEDGEIATIGSGSSKNAVKITEKPPTIGGIGIVCKGGGDPAVQKRLLGLLSAAFDVSSSKIYIAESQK